MESITIISLILNFAAVVGVILLHARQVVFEKRAGQFLLESSARFHAEISATKSALLKTLIVGGVAAIISMFAKNSDDDQGV